MSYRTKVDLHLPSLYWLWLQIAGSLVLLLVGVSRTCAGRGKAIMVFTGMQKWLILSLSKLCSCGGRRMAAIE
jgi:hypothetical protein